MGIQAPFLKPEGPGSVFAGQGLSGKIKKRYVPKSGKKPAFFTGRVHLITIPARFREFLGAGL
jgi:hypothetical protein